MHSLKVSASILLVGGGISGRGNAEESRSDSQVFEAKVNLFCGMQVLL